MTDNGDRRFPRRVYGVGEDPDPRFSLANERTFLAWLRTALALFAIAFALQVVGLPGVRAWHTVTAVAFLLLGALCTVRAWCGWMQTERALRRGTPMPGQPLSFVLAFGVLLAIAGLAVGVAV